MAKPKKCILLPIKDAEKLLENYCVANYALQLFMFACQKQKVEVHIELEEMCDIFEVDANELRRIASDGLIAGFNISHTNVYSAYDIVREVEKMKRGERLKMLHNLPSIDC